MRRLILILTVLGALAGGGLAACDGLLNAPGALSGSYVLQQANDGPLPFVISSSAAERYELLSEVLHFQPGREVVRERTIRHAGPDAGRDTTCTQTLRQDYRLRGERLEIGSFQPCPPNANCIANDTGTAGHTRITIESRLYSTGPQTPRLVYVRQ